MRVFMLKPVRVTALREAALPAAPSPCPGRRGQGFAPSTGTRGPPGRRSGYRTGSWGRTGSRPRPELKPKTNP